MVVVLYFAACRARTACEREDLPVLAGKTVAEAKAHLCTLHPGLHDIIAQCRVALDHAFVDDTTRINAVAEFALIPPVAGG